MTLYCAAFNLINEIDVEKTEARVAAYKAENAALIELNIQREERDLMTAQEEEERERQERLERAKDIRREEELERIERAKESQKILEDLARVGNAQEAARIVALSRAATAKRAEARLAALNAASMATMSGSKRKQGEVTIPDPPHRPFTDNWYAYEDKYVLRRDYDDSVSELARGDLEMLMRAGGYRVEDAWDRAIRFAVAGLDSRPVVGLSS
jgi:CDK-activating kinase assembly factor MAT1